MEMTTIRSTLRFSSISLNFLELPAEIRDLIYEHALRSLKPTVTFHLDHFQKDSYQEASQPPLTRVNRQVRRESLKIFYEVNDFILHTEGPKWIDARKWLRCYEAQIPNLLKVSLWIRYVTLTNPKDSNGAISVQLMRANDKEPWRVSYHWQWITVTRKPQGIESDARFLMEMLSWMVADESHDLSTSEGFISMMADLRLSYIKEKMSWQ